MTGDGDLTQAVQRAYAAYFEGEPPTEGTIEYQLWLNVAKAVLAEPVSAPDRDEVAGVLAEVYGIDGHPDHQRAADALISAGLVRTPVTSEQIEQAAKAVHAESEKCWTTPHAWKDELPTVQEMYRRYSRAAAKALGLSVVEGGA